MDTDRRAFRRKSKIRLSTLSEATQNVAREGWLSSSSLLAIVLLCCFS